MNTVIITFLTRLQAILALDDTLISRSRFGNVIVCVCVRMCVTVIILLTMPNSIPAVLVQAYNMGLVNNEFVFITVDFFVGIGTAVGIIYQYLGL